jgi:hypothetical protein
VSEAVILRKRSQDVEADRILNRFEELLGIHPEHLGDGGRRYDLSTARDLLIASASVRGQLELIDPSWATYLELEPD